MINIVIPMAGAGSRFSSAGYLDPKPLILVHNIPMIKLVIENLKPDTDHRFIFICQRKHVEKYDLEAKFSKWTKNPIVIMIDGLTEGAACTVLKARSYIENDDSLMIANSDQYVTVNINTYLNQLDHYSLDGLIMTMKARDKKWSYVELDSNDYVVRVVEKEVISDEATVGIYNFRKGINFVRAADKMIKNKMKVNNEYYVAPVYNMMIEENARIGISNIGSVDKGMYGLGTPSDLENFLNLPISKKVTK